MAQTTFANGRGIVHTKSGGCSLVCPDICNTLIGIIVVPVPYPNLGQASDTSKGPTTVRTDGQMPMVKEALYSKSTCDEPGSLGGIFSGTFMNVCEFLTYSFDVRFEGRGVCRVLDTVMHNKKNITG